MTDREERILIAPIDHRGNEFIVPASLDGYVLRAIHVDPPETQVRLYDRPGNPLDVGDTVQPSDVIVMRWNAGQPGLISLYLTPPGDEA
jgi:hypothetical protein